MEMRHLRYFVAVAESGSLSRAAEKLFIAQPPLSLQIRQFEEELGVALFVRHPKGVRLTLAGQALLPEARYLLERMGRIGNVARQSRQNRPVSLSMGFVPSSSHTVLPILIRKLRAKYPGLELELREMISEEQISAIADGRIDVGIARSGSKHPRVQASLQMSDPFCLALPTSFDLAPEGAVDLRNYSDQAFVGFSRSHGPAYFDQSIHLCSQAGFSPRIRYEASNVRGVLDLVSAGLGIALVPASTVQLGVKGLAWQRLTQKPFGVLSVLRRKGDTQPAVQTLETVVEKIFEDLRLKVDARLAATARARPPRADSRP